MSVLLVTSQTITVNSGICLSSLRSALACRTGKWRTSRFYGELQAHMWTEGHLTVTFKFRIYRRICKAMERVDESWLPKRAERPSSSSEKINRWNFTLTPPIHHHDMVLLHRDSSIFITRLGFTILCLYFSFTCDLFKDVSCSIYTESNYKMIALFASCWILT
jgi:hypothetical protein